MRGNPSAYLGFNISTLHAEIPVPYQEFERATRALDSPLLILPERLKLRDPEAAILIQAQVEHEFFHARHSFSSTFGWFLHFLHWSSNNYRKIFIGDVDYSKLILDSRGWLHSFLDYKKSWHATFSVLALVYLGNLLDLIRQPNEELVSRMDPGRDGLRRWLSKDSDLPLSCDDRSMGPDEFRHTSPLGWLPNVVIPDLPASGLGNVSLADLLEGVATWREYMVISQLTWGTVRHNFQGITRRWINKATRRPTYRRAADAIGRVTGCNMSMMVPGVMMDVALNPPIGPARIEWHDFHPAIRFNRMLVHAVDLPKRYRTVDNCEHPDDVFYKEVEQFFCSRLNWPTVRASTTALANELKRAGKYLVETDPFNQLGRAFILMKFVRALEARDHASSTFLFPWNASDPTELGYEIRPLFVEWWDQVTFSAPTMGEVEVLRTEASVAMARMALEMGLKLNPGPGRDLGHVERLYHKLRRERPEAYPKHIYTFISQQLGVAEEDFRKVIVRTFV